MFDKKKMAQLAKKEKSLHKKEEKQHHFAERAMEKDEKIHKKLAKVHRKEDKKPSATKRKIKKVMKEFSESKLHSSSKKGPIVTNPKQAIAIGYSEARRAKSKKK